MMIFWTFLFEIKPDSEKNKTNNIIKENTLIKWCAEHNYTYKKIDDSWFKENYIKYKNIIYGQPNEKKMLKNLRQFEK